MYACDGCRIFCYRPSEGLRAGAKRPPFLCLQAATAPLRFLDNRHMPKSTEDGHGENFGRDSAA